jgi:hypothetical protein
MALSLARRALLDRRDASPEAEAIEMEHGAMTAQFSTCGSVGKPVCDARVAVIGAVFAACAGQSAAVPTPRR